MVDLVVVQEIVLIQGEIVSASLLLKSDHDAVHGSVDLIPFNRGLALTRAEDGSLIHEVLER